jgi:hypothetical protein
LTKFISENISNIVMQYCLAFLPWSSDWNRNDPIFGAPHKVAKASTLSVVVANFSPANFANVHEPFGIQKICRAQILPRKNFGAQNFWRTKFLARFAHWALATSPCLIRFTDLRLSAYNFGYVL